MHNQADEALAVYEHLKRGRGRGGEGEGMGWTDGEEDSGYQSMLLLPQDEDDLYMIEAGSGHAEEGSCDPASAVAKEEGRMDGVGQLPVLDVYGYSTLIQVIEIQHS